LGHLNEGGDDWGDGVVLVERDSSKGELGGDLKETHLLCGDSTIKRDDVFLGGGNGSEEIDKLGLLVLENSLLLLP